MCLHLVRGYHRPCRLGTMQPKAIHGRGGASGNQLFDVVSIIIESGLTHAQTAGRPALNKHLGVRETRFHTAPNVLLAWIVTAT